MGKRSVLDFVNFYLYVVAGALLSVTPFNFVCPVQRFDLKEWSIHLFETGLKIACY